MPEPTEDPHGQELPPSHPLTSSPPPHAHGRGQEGVPDEGSSQGPNASDARDVTMEDNPPPTLGASQSPAEGGDAQGPSTSGARDVPMNNIPPSTSGAPQPSPHIVR